MKSEKPEKKPEKSPEKKDKNLSKNNYDVDIQTCSATDCTGLIPALPESEAELEAYEDLYPYITHAKNKVEK